MLGAKPKQVASIVAAAEPVGATTSAAAIPAFSFDDPWIFFIIANLYTDSSTDTKLAMTPTPPLAVQLGTSFAFSAALTLGFGAPSQYPLPD